jgi:hypothetical protein
MFSWIDFSRTTPLFWTLAFIVFALTIASTARVISPLKSYLIAIALMTIVTFAAMGAWGILVLIVGAPAAAIPLIAGLISEKLKK